MTKKTAWAMTGILRCMSNVTGTGWIKHELGKIIREDRAAAKKPKKASFPNVDDL